jgi:hypothetical protein
MVAVAIGAHKQMAIRKAARIAASTGGGSRCFMRFRRRSCTDADADRPGDSAHRWQQRRERLLKLATAAREGLEVNCEIVWDFPGTRDRAPCPRPQTDLVVAGRIDTHGLRGGFSPTRTGS